MKSEGSNLSDLSSKAFSTSAASAVLDALSACVALLDERGFIVSVNQAWRRFAFDNEYSDLDGGIGANYLDICDGTMGGGSTEAAQVASGIRAVLSRQSENFSIEYPCHSPTEQRWFLMTATAVSDHRFDGVVVMHVDISERIRSEAKIRRLNRVYAVLSGVNSLIVRATDRDELFRGVCRIAADLGHFHIAWIGTVDRIKASIVPAEISGAEPGFLTLVEDSLVLGDTGPFANTMAVMAVRDRKVVVCNDIRACPEIPFVQDLIGRGITSMAIFPLLVADRVVGVIALYADQADCFDQQEKTLLGELADDVGMAMDYIEKSRRLKYLAYYDSLTGLANRSLFLERISKYQQDASRSGGQLVLCLIDIERFRNVNDSLGRSSGDLLLRQVAEWLTRYVGDIGRVARVGIDLFGVVLPELAEEDDIVSQLDLQMTAFLNHTFQLNDGVLRVAARAGIAVFPQHGSDADILLQNAEAALENAKTSGGRYRFFSQKVADAIADRLALESQLRQAVEKKEFVVHYQPKIEMESGRVTGAEALLRWTDPLSKLSVSPAKFIPILEETGLIHEVGLWVMRQAIEDGRRWRLAGLAPVAIAVNVSPMQLRNRGFISEVELAIGIDPLVAAGLEFEITESLIIEDFDYSIVTLKAIRSMGISIAIDDFGTGFSSLGYLAKLPINSLKIDQSFVTSMTDGPKAMALVSTIINLAHALRLKVVAEGVETREQSQLLQALGCDQFQGFFYSAAVPVAVFEKRFLALASP